MHATTSTSASLYRTTISQSRQAPRQHESAYRSYSWYVDIDDLPQWPWWLRPFARFEAGDHFPAAGGGVTLRQQLESVFADHEVPVPDGRITGLLQARVFGYEFNPLSIFWCHDRDGSLRHVVAAVHTTHDGRDAYLLPPAESPVLVSRQFCASPAAPVDGHYLVLAPRPEDDVDIMVSLLRERRTAFTATLRGERLPATTRHVAIMQFLSPLRPLITATRMRVRRIKSRLHTVPVDQQ